MKTLKKKITTDSVMEELKKKMGRTDLTNEGFLDWLTGGSKKADAPAPNPDANAGTAKGPEPAPAQAPSTASGPSDKPPEAPSTASGPAPAAPAMRGSLRQAIGNIGGTPADDAAGPPSAVNTPGAVAVDKGVIAKTDISTAKGIGGTDSKIPDEVKQAKAAEIEKSDKEAGLTPTTPPSKEVGSGRGSTIEAPGARAAAQNQTFSQAFAAARKESGGAGGKFTYNGKEYQTNVKGEKYSSPSKLKTTGVYSESFEQFVRNQFIAEAKKEEMEEAIDNANPGLGPRYNPKKTVFKTELHKGSRNWGGNQKRSPATYAEEATKMVKKKVMEKKKEQPLGSTSTGKNGETITMQPTKPELTGYH